MSEYVPCKAKQSMISLFSLAGKYRESLKTLERFTFDRPSIPQEQKDSTRQTISHVPNQIRTGGLQQRPASHLSQTNAKKRNLDTYNHSSSRERINPRKQSNSLDMIKNPSLSTLEFTQSYATTTEISGTSIASKDRMTEVQITTDSVYANTADYQRSHLASYPESIMDIASSMARSTLSYYTNTKAP